MDLSSQPTITSDEAIQIVGGSNRFQIIVGALLILSFNTNSSLIYGLAFLQDKGNVELKCAPKGGTVHDCEWKEACDRSRTESHWIDWSRSKHNFISDFD